MEEADDVRKVERTFEKQISDLNATIHKIQATNMKAMQKLDEAQEKLEMANKDFDTVRRKAKQASRILRGSSRRGTTFSWPALSTSPTPSTASTRA